ncbi:MAG: histidine--tRNA ligase [Muribaculaceae bacterium]|nr:histidine--tRNA ligase [Muribaculaceae bacterium]
MAVKPSIPKGTRDFSPVEMAKRNYIFDTIKDSFRLFGYRQIETPAMENLSTLMGKYGEEGDRLLFKILNSGDFLKDVSDSELNERNSVKIISRISEKGLRYDLTVPFARFVVQNRNDITLPFKRFQIQPVWRADRPQKGRYREFFQCDADVVGSDSLFNEIELLELIDNVYDKLGIRVVIKLNNRKILSGIAEIIGEPEKLTEITVAIDKIEKIGIDKVTDELRGKNISEEAIEKLRPLLSLEGENKTKLMTLRRILSDSEIGMKGIEELETVTEGFDKIGHLSEVEIDVSLARGLNYYTGTIIEVKAKDVEIGSITGGGRYDNLTGVFGLPGLSGVGISFGADRIYDVLNQLNLYPENISESVKILFVNFGEKEALKSLGIIKKLRENGVSCELYPDSVKMKKQMSYADSLAIPFVAIIGENELSEGTINLKDMHSGEQWKLTEEEMINHLCNIAGESNGL